MNAARRRLDVRRSEVYALFAVAILAAAIGYWRTNEVSSEIQRERVSNIRAGCETQNRRNAVAYAFLKSLPPNPNQPRRSPAEQRRLLHGFTDALVGAVRDCDAAAEQAAPSKP